MTFLVSAGASVAWVPFDGGHEIPFMVWRELRKFLRSIARPLTRVSTGKLPIWSRWQKLSLLVSTGLRLSR